MGTVFLILLLLALCGFIAYIGDLLGRRFGKKRLTLFGLRPKHTAIILTIATGVLIAALTFCTALLVVPGFREAVTQGERLVGQNDRLRAANARERASNGRLEMDNRRLSSSNSGLLTTNAELTRTNTSLQRTNETLGRQSSTLRARNGELSHANGKLQAHNGELRSANSTLAADNTRLRSEQSRLQTSMSGLRQQIKGLQAVANNYRQEQYIYRREQPIDQSVIPYGDVPPRLLRTTVVNLLYSAERTAANRGARAADGRKSIYLVPPKDYPRDRPVEDAAIRDWLLQRAAAFRHRPLFWRVVANENAISGRPVPARLEWYTNDTIFRAGQMVKARGIGCWWPVDGSKATEGAILGELIYFLKSQVTNAARAQQIVPNQEGFVGELNYDQLIDVAKKVKAINNNAVVVAYARQNTYRAGPLNVDLKVFPVDSLPDDVKQAIEEVAGEGARH